jgi:hypothetical protein
MYFPYLSTHLILADFVASVISGEDILLNLLLFSFLPCFYFLDLWPEYSPKQAVFKYLQYVLPLIEGPRLKFLQKIRQNYRFLYWLRQQSFCVSVSSQKDLRWVSAGCVQFPSLLFACYTSHATERRGWVVNTLASYSGGPGFKSRPGNRISGLRFSWFSSIPPAMCLDSILI